jgi:integrase
VISDDQFRVLPKDRPWLAGLSFQHRRSCRAERVTLGEALEVTLEKTGAKIFYARIRRQGDQNPRRVRIGSFPTFSVADARLELQRLKSLAKEGRDPALEQRRAKAGVSSLRTLSELIAAYLERRNGAVAPKTLRIERELLKGVLEPAIGDRLLSDLEPMDFGSTVAKYAARLKKEGRSEGVNANKLLAASRRLFKTARGWGLFTGPDPTGGLSRPAKEAPRNRILFDGKVLVGPDPKLNELGMLVRALMTSGDLPADPPTRTALLLAILLGFRSLEVCSLEWSSIRLDGEPPTLNVGKSKTKAGLRTLPLPSFAIELLRAHRTTQEDSVRKNKGRDTKPGESEERRSLFLFPAVDGAKRTEHMHSESLTRAFSRICDHLGIADATLHDLRRTCLSGLIELGHEPVTERIAGHAPRHVLGRHYNRSLRLEPMRVALEA